MTDKRMADLHVHLDGSISFELARKLARIQGEKVLEREELVKRMRVSPDCRDLNEYLTKFAYPLSLLQTREAVSLSVFDLLCRQQAQGLAASEIRFAPQLHRAKGMSQREVVAAALQGRDRYLSESNAPMKTGLILCCMRGDSNRDENMETVEVAGEFLGKGVCALDLAGAEGLFPTGNFEDVFQFARECKIPFTIHAGEADGPGSIWKALEFGAKRIGHGVRCLEDPALVRYLAEKEIPLELCPTSNLNTKIFSDICQYPLLKLMEEGVKVTINTDNMTVSGVTLPGELKLVTETFGLSEAQTESLLENGIGGLF